MRSVSAISIKDPLFSASMDGGEEFHNAATLGATLWPLRHANEFGAPRGML